MFFGIFLVEVGLSWLIAESNIVFRGIHPGFYVAFDILFGGLLLSHGLLKRGHPYRIGKVGTLLGLLFLAVGTAEFFGAGGGFGWAILFILLGAFVIFAALGRRWY
jgi:hypothetical protein